MITRTRKVVRSQTSPIGPFDVKAWRKGVMFDAKRSARGADSILTEFGVEPRITPVKVKAIKTTVKPVDVPSADPNKAARTLAEHRAKIEEMGQRYDAGLDPLTGLPITDENELDGILAPREDRAWSTRRNGARNTIQDLILKITGKSKSIQTFDAFNLPDDPEPVIIGESEGD